MLAGGAHEYPRPAVGRPPQMIRLSRLMIAIAAFGLVACAASRVRSPLGRYLVEGASMEPAYRSGERLLVNRLAYLRAPPHAGDVVVVRDPERAERHLLKRVAVAPDDAAGRDVVWLLGDNAAASRDSRSFGAVPRAAIVGRAWRKY